MEKYTTGHTLSGFQYTGSKSRLVAITGGKYSDMGDYPLLDKN